MPMCRARDWQLVEIVHGSCLAQDLLLQRRTCINNQLCDRSRQLKWVIFARVEDSCISVESIQH